MPSKSAILINMNPRTYLTGSLQICFHGLLVDCLFHFCRSDAEAYKSDGHVSHDANYDDKLYNISSNKSIPKPFECEICGAIFAIESVYDTHVNLHGNYNFLFFAIF